MYRWNDNRITRRLGQNPMKKKSGKTPKPLGISTGANFNLKKHNKKMRLMAESKGLDQ